MMRHELITEVKDLAVRLDELSASAFNAYYQTGVDHSDHVFFRDAGDDLAEAQDGLRRFLARHKK